MASVVRDAKARSPYWYACFSDSNGRRLKKSTELTSKSKALEMAHQRYTHHELERMRAAVSLLPRVK